MSEPRKEWGHVFARVTSETELGGPHCWIQWKGTNVCMDVHCACGQQHHVDADFAYTLRCAGCNRVYAVGQFVRLVELRADEIEPWTKNMPSVITMETNDAS